MTFRRAIQSSAFFRPLPTLPRVDLAYLSRRHFASVGDSPSHTPDGQKVNQDRATERAESSGGNPSVSKPISKDKVSQNPQETAEQGPTDEKLKQDPAKPAGEKKKQVESLREKPLGEEDGK